VCTVYHFLRFNLVKKVFFYDTISSAKIGNIQKKSLREIAKAFFNINKGIQFPFLTIKVEGKSGSQGLLLSTIFFQPAILISKSPCEAKKALSILFSWSK
jgi:hypothetical protein